MTTNESEAILIDALFREPDCRPQILDTVQPSDFCNGAYAKAFAALRELYQEGTAIDPWR